MHNNKELTVERFKKVWHCLVGSGEEMERMKRMESSESRDELEIGGRRWKVNNTAQESPVYKEGADMYACNR